MKPARKLKRRSRGFTLKPNQTLDIEVTQKSRMRLIYDPASCKARVVKRGLTKAVR